MSLAVAPLSNAMIPEALQFTRAALNASATLFFWIDEDRSVSGIEATGISTDIMHHYLEGMNRHDPLNVYELLDNRKKIAILEQERLCHSADSNRIYADFLGSYGMADEVDFVFWQDGVPFGCLSIMRKPGERPFSDHTIDWEAMRQYLEFNLKMHEKLRRARMVRTLTRQYGLTRREVEVVDLLNNGASNLTIAQIMGIGVATVKTYVINILNKLEVDNRAAIIAYTTRLQMP